MGHQVSINSRRQNQAMHRNRSYRSNIRRNSNASIREKEWAISYDQGGFACLEAQLKGSGRRRRRRTLQRRRQSRGLSGEKKGGRSNKYTATMKQRCMTCLNDMQKCFTAYINALVILGIYSDLF